MESDAIYDRLNPQQKDSRLEPSSSSPAGGNASMHFFRAPALHILAPLLRMRVKFKGLLCIIVLFGFLTFVSYWTKCSDNSHGGVGGHRHGFQTKYSLQALQKEDMYAEDTNSFYSNGNAGGSMLSGQVRNDVNANTFEEIECLINGEYSVSCRREGREVYLPFSFLHKYFEVYGKIVSYDGGYERFEWQHSYSKFFYPHGTYDPQGVFMHFENYNVEARDRVKCISAIDGVPVSTQWNIKGYYYPIQISQFGLSHFSKNLTEPKPRTTYYVDGEEFRGKWISTDGSSQFAYRWDQTLFSKIFTFEAPESLEDDGLTLKLDPSSDFVLSLDFRFSNNGSITITVEDREKQDKLHLHYVCTDTFLWVDGSHAYYGLGLRHQWSRLTRDLAIDLRKGFFSSKANKKTKFNLSKLRLLHLTVRGSGALDNLTVSSSAHLAHFYDAADWLLRNQDDQGGWPISVERRFSSSGMANLKPGWYSAMAQGQAMSVLTRAFRTTGQKRFLESALKATELFKVPSEDHGIRTMFLDKYVWYEEYPTIPSSFVLNGFIYALLGLYDLKTTCMDSALLSDKSCTKQETDQVTQLYEDGMKSLRHMLPFFDSGAASIYDLRHFSLGVAPNLARWDYHTLHIDQLLLLSTIDNSVILKSTAQRWIEYMKGKRAPHN